MRFKRPTVIESEPAFMNNYTLMGLLVVMIAFMWVEFALPQEADGKDGAGQA